MYCPKCGGLIKNRKCEECKEEINKELLKFSSEEQESEKDRLACILSYVFWPLGKLIKIENEDFYKFHSNQGFIVFLIELLAILSMFVPTVGLPVFIFLFIISVFFIYKGINNVIKQEKEKLPIIGDFIFFK